jgi:hypothetical protein
MYATLSVWTDQDTAERGPTVDEEEVIVTIERESDDDDVVIHLASDDGRAGLWTVALTLNNLALRELAAALADFSGHRSTPWPSCGPNSIGR